MTHAFLQAELTSLISDSKRRYNDIRTASEKSLSEIKSISVTSETQLAGDLCRKPQFIDPFLLACKSKNAKLATGGTACLQRLTASKAVPRNRLADVLDAFQDGVGAGYEPQLKILQTLPSLLQLYADDIHGELLARILELCTVLQSSRTAVVSNTAAATFHQLVSAVFENGARGDRARASEDNSGANIATQTTKTSLSDDATRLFEDFCLLLDQQPPQFLKVDILPPIFLLETLQTILSSYNSLLITEQHSDLKRVEHLVQGLIRCLSKKDSFSTTAHALSILLLVFQNHVEKLKDQVAPIIPLLVGALEKDGNPSWRRALFLEFFRSLCSDFAVLREIYAAFDADKNHAKLVGQLMSALVRIAAEDPTMIGLGRQSTVPVNRITDPKSEEAASIEAQGLGGAITSVTSNDSSTIGISTDWSLMAVPLLDQPDKATAPGIPSTYIYTLVLGCVSSLCDGLSKFIMPLSVPSRASQRDPSELGRRDSSATDRTEDDGGRKPRRPTPSSQKYQRLINPLTLTNHRWFNQIRTTADIIDTCWPAALATCSTFLNAALDSEFYHVLIRSVQKLAQVSGVLELSTPRDALLTTLAKASIPTNASSVIASTQSSRATRVASADHSSINDGIKSPTEPPQTPTFQVTSTPLNVRHLLCLRALLNLGIALGPTLERDAWFILIETMQTVEALIAMPNVTSTASQSGSPRVGGSANDGQTTLAAEIAAVQAATKRMLESTRGFSADSFTDIVQALLRLLGQHAEAAPERPQQVVASPTTPTRLGAPRPGHHQSRSVSGLWTKSKALELEIGFVLNKLSDLSRINIYRFTSVAEQSCSWTLIGGHLLSLSQDSSIDGTHRIQAASVLDLISMETVKLLDDPRFEDEEADNIRARCLNSLLEQLSSIDDTRTGKHGDVEMEIHKRLLDALESMLSHSGESMTNCWPIALQILSVTFSKRGLKHPQPNNPTIEQVDKDAQTAQILRIAFRSIQLITSDFLGVLNATSLSNLAQLLRQFGSQDYDLNVALTSTTVLWSLASHVLSKIETIDLNAMPNLDDAGREHSLRSNSSPDLIWSIILLELIALCKDTRADVRNAAIRVLLKMLDASSETLSPSTWAATLNIGPLNIVRHCISQYATDKTDQMAWMASTTQLVDGSVEIICHNLNVIAVHDGFKNTWLGIIGVLKEIVHLSSVSASFLTFSNLSKLVSALPGSGEVDEDLIHPAMQLWAEYHPARIQDRHEPGGPRVEEQSNQQALASHAHVLVEAYKASSNAVSSYLQGRTSILTDAIQHTVLLCTHPPYTSDIKSLTPDQKEASDCLGILKSLLRNKVSEYSEFLLRMLALTLNIQDGKIGPYQKRSAMSKSAQKPTFIAFASSCLDSYRNVIVSHSDGSLIQALAIRDACSVLSAVISTKYTTIPTNNQALLWRNATVTAVVMLEALQKRVCQKKPSEDLSDLGVLAPRFISIAISILQSGGLSNSSASTHKRETVLDDETFDIEHFNLLNKAIVAILQRVENTGEEAYQEYAVVLFKASLLAKPWFYDIPDDLVNEPLKGLTQIRAGSVHRPVFAVRRQMCYAALNALYELVQQTPLPTLAEDNDCGKYATSKHMLASAAAPYLILRVVHPLKTFLADQRLRSLTPPPIPQQVELHVILSKFVDLKSDGHGMDSLNVGKQGTIATIHDDGKAHLRMLYGMMLRVRKFWQGLPRLKGPGLKAWQDNEPGRGIEAALEKWQRLVAEGWAEGLSDFA